MANPYDSHPIYSLRRCLLFLATISFIIGTLACATSQYEVPIWAFHLLWTFCSAVWCIYDLVRYALEKARHPDAATTWPSKKIMIGDAVLIVLFGWWFALELSNSTNYYSSGTLAAYASITSLCYVILHGICFWKELIALKKASWLKELNKGSSDQCQSCHLHHAQCCTLEEYQEVDVNCPQGPPEPEQGSPRTIIPKPTSWLPAMLRRKKREAADLESSADSPNESTCLITPFTDDETPSSGSREDDIRQEGRIEHQEDSEQMIKKQGKKESKIDAIGNGEGRENEGEDILEQLIVQEDRLP